MASSESQHNKTWCRVTDGQVCLAQDLVFLLPPPQFWHGRGLEVELKHGVDLNQVWFGRVLLLFRVAIQHDCDKFEGDGDDVHEYDLAFLEVLTRASLPGHVNPHRRILVYTPKPKMRVYVIPVRHCL